MSVLFALQYHVREQTPKSVMQSQMAALDAVKRVAAYLLLEHVQMKQFVLQIVQMISFPAMHQVNWVIYKGVLTTKPLESRGLQFVYLYFLLSNTQFINTYHV